MKTVHWTLDTGFAGCEQTGEVVVEDDATEEDIRVAVLDDMWNYLNLSWHVVKEPT